MEMWVDDRCQDIETSLNRNNSKEAFQTIKDLTTKQTKTTTIHDKNGKCLTDEDQAQKRWTEYCSELYTPMKTQEFLPPHHPQTIARTASCEMK